MIASQRKDAVQKSSEASFHPWPYNSTNFGGFPKCHAQSGVNALPQNRSSYYEPLESYGELGQQPVYQHGYGSSSAYANPNTMQQYQWNAFPSQFNPFAVNYSFQRQLPQNYQSDHNLQSFLYFVVIDFEATCDKDRNPQPQEVIEFPSVVVNSSTGQLEACFQTYVRPTQNQVLSDFCKDLTGIEQIQVDGGITLSEALFRHDKWLEKKGIKNSSFAVVTWSNWDCQVLLESECRYKRVRKPPYFNRWIDLRVPFYEVFSGVKCSLKEAVEKAGLTWQGRPHCGLDDAKNTARLLVLLMQMGKKFSITSSLLYHPTNEPYSWKPNQEEPLPLLSHPQKSIEFQPSQIQYNPYCYCGVTSSKGMIRKPGPKKGNLFFGCGNWTAAKGARCLYFEWAAPQL